MGMDDNCLPSFFGLGSKACATLRLVIANRVCNGAIFIRHHPYIMSAIDWMGGSRFTDVQYCIYADLTLLESGWLGGSKKAQNYSDLIYEWSLA